MSSEKRSWGSARVVATAWVGTESCITANEAMPSTASRATPASSMAARQASVASSSTVRPDRFESSV